MKIFSNADFADDTRAMINNANRIGQLLAIPRRSEYQQKQLDELTSKHDGLRRAAACELRLNEMRDLDTFLRTGRINRNRLREVNGIGRELRDLGEVGMGVGTATGAGVLAPIIWRGVIFEGMAYAAPMLSVCDILDTPESGGYMPLPNDSDTASIGAQIGEGMQAATQDVPTYTQTIFSTYKFSSGWLRLSTELLTDSGFPLGPYIARKIAIRQARALNKFATIGSGSGTLTGFTTALKAAGFTYQTQASGNAIAISDITALIDTVDPFYRQRDAKFQAHPATIEQFREQVGTDGLPIFPGLHNSPDGVDRIFNVPILPNVFMDEWPTHSSSPAVSYFPLAYGDWSTFRLRIGPSALIRAVERFSDFGQVGFLQLDRFDSNLASGGAQSLSLLKVVY